MNQNLTVQVASNPAWYAVLALPYLMEYPYECSEQIFNRFYANALARHLEDTVTTGTFCSYDPDRRREQGAEAEHASRRG